MVRRGWIEATEENPPIYGQGALQHRWLLELAFVTDG